VKVVCIKLLLLSILSGANTIGLQIFIGDQNLLIYKNTTMIEKPAFQRHSYDFISVVSNAYVITAVLL
jgi:hypothetical protein